MFTVICVSAVTFGITVIFHTILTTLRPSFKFNNVVKRAKRVLFISAHPDDECMFFGPSLMSFIHGGCEVYILCLSTGNADGIGHIRKQELLNSCEILGIRKSNVILILHTKLPDGQRSHWRKDIVGKIALKYITQLSIDTVVTFDGSGVSGHPNHISCHNGMLYIVEKQLLPSECLVFTLLSVNVVRKYSGILDILYSYFMNENTLISSCRCVVRCHKAMLAHWSQLVWFRWLYVTFSSYMIVNTLKRLETPDFDDDNSDSLHVD